MTEPATVQAARAVVQAWQDEERAREVAEKRRFVGRFFKYRNCYSCPEPNEYWWMYGAVRGVDEYGTPTGLMFQRDYEGRVTVELGDRLSSVVQSGTEITSAEFWQAASEVLGAVTALLNRPARRVRKRRKSGS